MKANPLAPAFSRYFTQATVTEVETITPAMRHIRLVADEPIGLPYTPGQHVRIQINNPLSLRGLLRPVETLRAYTIWAYSPEQGALDLRIHLYDGDGIGLNWARAARPGDSVTFWGPQGDFLIRPAPFHLFAGEETATAAFGPMIGSLDPGARVYGVLESASAEDQLPIPGPHRLRRVHRDGASAASSQTLLAAVSELDLPDNSGVAYLAGEARTCQMIRDYLIRERNWPRAAIKVKPFWTPGKRGLH